MPFRYCRRSFCPICPKFYERWVELSDDMPVELVTDVVLGRVWEPCVFHSEMEVMAALAIRLAFKKDMFIILRPSIGLTVWEKAPWRFAESPRWDCSVF